MGRSFALAWPVMAEQAFRTLLRTVDIIVTALISPAAVVAIGLVLAWQADPVVRLLGSGDGEELFYVARFVIVYGLSAPALALYIGVSGSLQGASETRVAFFARLTEMFGFFVGFSYLAVHVLGWGILGAYVGVFLVYVWMALFVVVAFRYGNWATRAAEMIHERGSVGAND